MSATLVDSKYSGVKTVYENGDGTGGLMVTLDPSQSSPTTAATTSVPASATVVTLLAANTARRAASIFNDSDKPLYIKYGAGASLTSFKEKIAVGASWTMPLPAYTGIITGIWEAAPTGNARISEES